LAYDAYATFDRVEGFFLGVRASVFADLAAYAFVGVAGDEFSFVYIDRVLSLLFGFDDARQVVHSQLLELGGWWYAFERPASGFIVIV